MCFKRAPPRPRSEGVVRKETFARFGVRLTASTAGAWHAHWLQADLETLYERHSPRGSKLGAKDQRRARRASVRDQLSASAPLAPSARSRDPPTHARQPARASHRPPCLLSPSSPPACRECALAPLCRAAEVENPSSGKGRTDPKQEDRKG